MPASHVAQYSSAPSHSDLHSVKSAAAQGVEILEDKTGCRRKNGMPIRYSKGRFLGKGGFAKCYEVQDMETKEIFAAKIVSKASVTKPRAHAKLRSEISIHRSLDNDKVVHFYDYFEDSEYVYIILELCPNQTLNELMRKRPSKRLAEAECMFYMYELISALKYLHKRRVLHRDLKLGNLFLDANNGIKVGDFGLAAQLEHDGEKKRTICGTPNYIAPEILEGKHGHSYEVDIWSLGVIMYTMLCGRPPFETSDVKTTYRRIRYNQYSFPETVRLSDPAKGLIGSILQTDPRSRPSLDAILDSPWFQNYRHQMPTTISGYAASPRPVGGTASARSETPERGEANFARIDSPAPRFPLRDRSPGAVQTPSQASTSLPRDKIAPVLPSKSSPALPATSGGTTPGRYTPGMGNLTGRPPLGQRGNDENAAPHTGSFGASEGLKNAAQSNATIPAPQSPFRTPSTTSVGTARAQPNHAAPASYTPHPTTQLTAPRQSSHSHQPPANRESSVGGGNATKVVAHGYTSARGVSSMPRQPLHSASARYGSSDAAKVSTPSQSLSARNLSTGGGNDFAKSTPAVLRGSAVQPVPSRRPHTAGCESPRPAMLGTQAAVTPSGWESESARMFGGPPPKTTQEKRQLSTQSARKDRCSSTPALLLDGEPMTPGVGTFTPMMGGDSYRKAPDSGIRGPPSCRSNQGLNSPDRVNFAACFGVSEPSSSRSMVPVDPKAMPEIWVTKWVDYSSKYGVGYILSDGSIGVYFNDSTKIILGSEGTHFDYITRRTQEKPEVRTTHSFEGFPEELKKKVTLLRHFRNYMLTDILEKKDGASIGESSLKAPAQKEKGIVAPSQEPAEAGAPYVKKWTRNKHAIMFQLSNKIVQVVFFDKTEAVLSSKSHMVTYVDKKNAVCSYPLSNVVDVPSPELAKRLRYTKDILVNLLGARTSDAGLGGA